jgi:hypothetical protein
MDIKSKRMWFWIICLIIVALLTYIYIYFQVTQSEPYLTSKQFLMDNTDVIKNVGEPVKLSMNMFGGHDVRFYATSETEAKFRINIYGAKDKGKAVMELKKKEGVWQITKATLILSNDKQIELR